MFLEDTQTEGYKYLERRSLVVEHRSRGPMDKAPDYESGDCGFDPHRGCSICRGGLVGYDVCLTRRRSRVQSSPLVFFAFFCKTKFVFFDTKDAGKKS